MDTQTAGLFEETTKALESVTSALQAIQRWCEITDLQIGRLERRADAQSTIIRALSGDERVLHEHGD